MKTVAKKIERVRQKIHQAELEAHRPRNNVRLLAVSKTKPAAKLIQAYQQGQRHFGESYVQEALLKQQAMAQFDICWHFIGPIQSNKTRAIAKHFDWVHSVNRLKIAKRLSEQRPVWLPPLNICLQVNISAEPSKSGFTCEEIVELAPDIMQLPRLRLRGLMAIPAPVAGLAQQRIPFQQLCTLMAQLDNEQLDTLSMGMSNDLEAAVMEGASIIRVGTAIFGSRVAEM